MHSISKCKKKISRGLQNKIFFRIIHVNTYRPVYVDILKLLKDRAASAKFRFSAHNLVIEKGRHLNIEKKERKCLTCKEGVLKMKNIFNTLKTLSPIPENA